MSSAPSTSFTWAAPTPAPDEVSTAYPPGEATENCSILSQSRSEGPLSKEFCDVQEKIQECCLLSFRGTPCADSTRAWQAVTRNKRQAIFSGRCTSLCTDLKRAHYSTDWKQAVSPCKYSPDAEAFGIARHRCIKALTEMRLLLKV